MSDDSDNSDHSSVARALRRVGALLCLLAVLLVGAVGGFVWYAGTTDGEEWLRVKIRDAVSAQLPGVVHVESLRDFELLSPIGVARAHATGVRFETSEGRETIRVNDATIEYSWAELLSDNIQINYADVSGGTVIIKTNPDGGTYIEDVFYDGGGDSKNQPANPMTIELRNMRVQDMKVIIQPDDDTNIIVDDVEGTVDILQTAQDDGIRIELSDIKGVVTKPSILGARFRFSRADGEIRGAADDVVDIDFDGTFMKKAVSGRVRFVPDDEKSVKIGIDAKGPAGQLVANLADFRTLFGGSVEIDLY